MNSIRRTAALAGGVLLLSGLAACSSSSPEASSSASMVGGMTECTKDKVGPAADEAAKALGADNVYTVDNLECADGWAVTTGILGTGSTDANAPEGAPTSFVFQAEGQFWVPQDKAKVCGTADSANPDAVPSDATIPAALYPSGCLAG